MVGFSNIFIKIGKDKLGFNCFDLFNEFREELWALGPRFESQLLKKAFLRQREAERKLEIELRLPEGTLSGTCFIFGSELAVKKQLARPELVEFLKHWGTSAEVEINVVCGGIKIKIVGHSLRCSLVLPIKRALFPIGAQFNRAYANIATRRQSGIPPRSTCLSLSVSGRAQKPQKDKTY